VVDRSDLAGTAQIFYAFDVGQEIDLAAAERALGGGGAMQLALTHHAPSWFQFAPAPLRVLRSAEPLAVGRWRTKAEVELVLYEFGGVSLGYRIESRGPWSAWIELSCALSDDVALAAAARAQAEGLLAAVGGSVKKPGVAAVVEDYAVFALPELAQGENADDFVAQNGLELARLLRAERGVLSQQEIADALSARVSFHASDLALIDWNAAAVFDDEPGDAARVLEFANVQLLEQRFLDAQLDRSLDRAFDLLARRRFPAFFGPLTLRRSLAQVSEMQVEGALLFERIGNALKLFSDQYLARVLRAAGQRFRSAEWNAGILRKLEALESVYAKLDDQATTLRMEFLEWAIVLLIVAEIVLSFLR
jgi:hypothetical protein